MIRAPTIEAILIVLLASVSLPAAADPDRTATAKEAFERATQHYNLGEFEEALVHFRKAYEAKPLPALLFNIAQCHRNAGRPRQAIFFFERFLQERPDTAERAEIERLIDELRAQVTEPRAPSTPPAALPPPPPRPLATPIAPPPPPAETTSVSEKWWFWTALLAGTAVIAGGTALAVRAAERNDLPDDPIATFDHRGL